MVFDFYFDGVTVKTGNSVQLQRRNERLPTILCVVAIYKMAAGDRTRDKFGNFQLLFLEY